MILNHIAMPVARTLRYAAGLAVLLSLGACTSLLNASIPGNGYHVVKNVAYGQDARQKLDLYVPDGTDKPKGVLLFFYGGSWQTGSKDDYRFVGQAFASKGYITVIADYRLYPQVYFPDFMDDGAHALVWVHKNISQYGGDPARVFVSGHSAGAYIAVMLGVNDSYIKKAGGQAAWTRGTLGISGPYDFLPLTDPDIIAVFSRKPSAETQPITYATHKTAPMFLATGDADDTVGIKNSRNLTAKLEALHSPVEMHVYPDIGHIGIVLSLAYRFRGKAPLLEDMVAFMDREGGVTTPAK